jgi:hypothetical protein
MAQALASSLCVRSPSRLLIPSSSLEPTVCPPCSSTVCFFPRASLFSFHSCFDAVLSSPAHYSHSRTPRIAAASASADTSNELISSQVKQLRTIFSEFGLIRYRVLIEVRWIQKLSQLSGVEEVPSFSAGAMSVLEDMVTNFGVLDAAAVKKRERITNHDVKAVEYVLKEKFHAHPELSKVLEFIHFACTSEDINNLAHALMLQKALQSIVLPAMDRIVEAIQSLAHQHAEVAMLARTHGQVNCFYPIRLPMFIRLQKQTRGERANCFFFLPPLSSSQHDSSCF